jgi:transposase
MYQCQFSIEDQDQIRYQRYHHLDPVIRKRMTILWHKHNGLPHQTIAKLSDAAPNTVTATIRTYAERGLAGVQERSFYCPASQLDPYRSLLAAHFLAHPPRTLKEAGANIEQLTGLSFTLPHVRHFLLSIGLSRKKQEAFQGNWTTPREKSKKHLLTTTWNQT